MSQAARAHPIDKAVRWKLTLGDDGVLIAGRFLWLRALVWAAILFAGALFFFFASIFLGTWAHLRAWANYPIALGVPCLAYSAYAMAVRNGESKLRVTHLRQKLASAP